MTKQYFSIPVKYNFSDQLQADDLKIPVEVLVMHDQINLNNSNFDFEVIDAEVTKDSLKNIPILGYIKKVDGSDEKDFAGHEIEIVFKDGDLKIIYLERPIGILPETNHYEYVEIDGKKYVKVIGYIWKSYLNDGYEILQETPEKSVSMEIVVDAYEVRKDGILDVKAYRYTGVTVLGDNVNPAMQGANMRVIGQFENNQRFSNEFYERVEQLNKELKDNSSKGGETQNHMTEEEKGVKNLDEKLELIGKYNLTLEELNFEIEELSLEELEEKLKEFTKEDAEPKENNTDTELSFSATYRQKREAINNALDPVFVKDEQGKIVSETFYYLDDFSDEYCMVEKYVWTATDFSEDYGRFTYTLDESALSATITSEFEKLIKTALTQTEYDKVMAERESYEAMVVEFEQLKTQITEYENKVSEFEVIKTENETLTIEINTLKEFKQNVEYQIEVGNKRVELEELTESFESALKDNEEFETIKSDIADDEKIVDLEYETVEKELYAIVGKIKFEVKKRDKKEKKVNFSRVNIGDSGDTGDKNEYGEASKYFPKKD